MFVARQLAGMLGDAVVTLPAANPIPSPDKGRVLWVFPVYSWGVPPAVESWIKTMEIPGAATACHSLVVTCGDDAGLADRQWRRLLASRGWTGGDAWSVEMPNTYVLMKGFDVDPPELADSKIARSGQRIEHIASMISSRTPMPAETTPVSDLVRGAFPWVKSAVIYPWFVRHAMSPRPFHSTSRCNGCGLCSRSCPLKNITMEGHKPLWHDDCAMCLRCYHGCPRHAVAYAKSTRGKGQKRQLTDLVMGQKQQGGVPE